MNKHTFLQSTHHIIENFSSYSCTNGTRAVVRGFRFFRCFLGPTSARGTIHLQYNLPLYNNQKTFAVSRTIIEPKCCTYTRKKGPIFIHMNKLQSIGRYIIFYDYLLLAFSNIKIPVIKIQKRNNNLYGRSKQKYVFVRKEPQ